VLHPALDESISPGLLTSFGAALIPVLFAYGGWQTANFIGGEIKDPRRNLPRALLIGVAGVVVLYITVNISYLRALGPVDLAASTAPATATMRRAFGDSGARFIAFAIATSTLGFLSQSVLTAPRVYFAMAEDGLFFRQIAKVNSRTHVPIAAIVLQSVWTIVVAFSGRYDQILNYVVSMDFLFFGLTASCLFVFRRRDRESGAPTGYRVPGHPWTTGIFVAVSWIVVANTIFRYPANSLLGMGILVLGLPVYAFWYHRGKRETRS
jgi:APA family basic amino acid/polyamine antiporter